MTAKPTQLAAHAAMRAASIDDLRSKAPRTSTARIVLAEIPEPSPHDSEEAWDDYRVRVAEATVEVTFRSIGRRRYDELQKAYPPTPGQIADFKRKGLPEPVTDPEKFTAALIAASSVSPKLSYEEVRELVDSEAWNDAELNELFMAALNVNQSSRTAALGKDFGRTNGSGA